MCSIGENCFPSSPCKKDEWHHFAPTLVVCCWTLLTYWCILTSILERSFSSLFSSQPWWWSALHQSIFNMDFSNSVGLGLMRGKNVRNQDRLLKSENCTDWTERDPHPTRITAGPQLIKWFWTGYWILHRDSSCASRSASFWGLNEELFTKYNLGKLKLDVGISTYDSAMSKNN